MTPPKIVTIESRLLVGLDTEHSVANSKAKELWTEFIPYQKSINNNIDENMYSVPASEYEMDNRAHFEILGEKFKGSFNPESEEGVWIPIRKIELV